MQNNACFYESGGPNLVKWAWSAGKGFVKGAPICNDYCDKWFEACKNDRTNSDNWLRDSLMNIFEHGTGSVNSSKCHTFAAMPQNVVFFRKILKQYLDILCFQSGFFLEIL
jgi:hypothetical protein